MSISPLGDASLWTVEQGEGPLLAVALHSGHDLRAELGQIVALDEFSRRREEDPFTDDWTTIFPNRIIVQRSRFEVDLNRPRDASVYASPAESWGLRVWRQTPTTEMVARSLAEYDCFYSMLAQLLDQMVARYGKIAVYELHSYNYRRAGPDSEEESAHLNPDINLGTATLNRDYWAPLLDRFIAELQHFPFPDRRLDVRENVKFYGRHFPFWIHRRYPEGVCVLSIEVKKFFMDEWTGEPCQQQLKAVQEALASTIPGIIEELQKLGGH